MKRPSWQELIKANQTESEIEREGEEKGRKTASDPYIFVGVTNLFKLKSLFKKKERNFKLDLYGHITLLWILV